MTARIAELDQPSLDGVDVESVQAQWDALAPPYDVERWLIPLPLWATRDYDHDGPAAWDVLRTDLALADPDRPLCIYIHVPFCSTKCHFCDSYSFRLPSTRDGEKQRYVRQLCDELRLWSEQGSLASRPVSTVHLGGGTPTFIGTDLLGELCECCRSHFNTSPSTEWALESTAHSLTPEMIDAMGEFGFDRLHIGVQSLEDPVREIIGPRCPADEALGRIAETLGLGWIVSVDMVCGLPLQTIPSFARDIETLIAMGVDGVSLYELLIYPQNRRWAAAQHLTGRSHLVNYLTFQLAAAILERNGYRKNTFNHWAGSRDDNRYFTFPARDEDCLAVGTIADGVFGEYHFRHPRYAAYLRAASASSPGLEGGLRRTAYESEMHALTVAITSGRIPKNLMPYLLERANGAPLRDSWVALRLVAETDDGGLSLLANGSWFAGNMIKDLTGLYPSTTKQR
ncbi:MAG: radical SAM protein [Solirubrobacteraceae bacterium]|jgi:oxygen-independent coproporphyrinogen-3 oxidase